MSNVQSYNALIDRFKAFASGHFILKSFSHGQIDTADLEKFTEYPFMHVVPSNVTYAKGTKTFSFQIVLADLPRDKDDKVEFQREVLSDLQRIAEDLVAEITNHRVLFGDLITVQNVSLEPFLEEFHNTLTGWTVSLDILVPYYWDACSIPAEWNDFFESSTGGTGSILSFVDSITRDENGNVSLVNDEATPAPHYYYGTNDEGVRGWYLLTDEVGLTCATIGTCQTIIDIESAIDDLQTEILLKANTADISAVGFSNDYNDLDNLPNLSGYGDMFKSVYDTDVDGVVDSAERIQIVVRNSTGSTLTKGQIVYLSGATGNRPNAVLAQANTELTSSKTIGMVIADITNNTDGQIAVNGTLHDLDTSAFTAGDTLWLSATTAGGMVANTPPSEPNHAVFIGYVARSHPNLGRIVLAIQNGYELDELHGVLITTPANNEVLTYESSTSLWKNKTITTALGYTPVPTTRSITINGTTQDLSADRTFTIASNPGTVTSVAALTLGTTGTDLSSTVANSTSTPVITLNVPTASATNRGVLSSTDWSTFNAKQAALVSGTNIKTLEGQSLLGSGNIDLTKSDVGLSNVDDTSDANKPVSTATQTALNLKENSANKQNSLAIDGSGTKFPTVDAVNNLSFIDKFKRGVQYFTDFDNTASATPNFANFAVGGAVNRVNTNVPNWASNQIGVCQYQTGTTSTGYFTHINEGFIVNQFIFGGGSWVFESYVNVETLSDAANRFRFVTGFGNSATNASEQNGAYFTYDEGGIQNGTIVSPNWQCLTSLASTRTLTTTTVAVTAGAWVKLRIEVNATGTSVTFYINGTLVATHTTNIPTYIAGNAARGFNVKQGILKSTGTTNRNVYCDYLGYENVLTTPR